MLVDVVCEWLNDEGFTTAAGPFGFFVRGGTNELWAELRDGGILVARLHGSGKNLVMGERALFDPAHPRFFDDLLAWVREHAA